MPSIAEVLHNKGYRNFAESISTKDGRVKLKDTWDTLALANFEFYSVNGVFNDDLREALQKISTLLTYEEVWESREEWWWKPLIKLFKPYTTALIYTALVKLKKRGINVI